MNEFAIVKAHLYIYNTLEFLKYLNDEYFIGNCLAARAISM